MSTMPRYVGRDVLAKLLGVTDRWVSNLVNDGVLPKEARGEFDLALCIQAYVRYREKQAADKASRPDDAVEVERVRRMRRENDEAERLLIPVDEAIDSLSAIIGPIQADLATIPVHSTDDPRLRSKIDDVVTRVINGIAKRFGKVGPALRNGRDPFAAAGQGNTDELGEDEDVSVVDGQARAA
jgi:hypothetical protein